MICFQLFFIVFIKNVLPFLFFCYQNFKDINTPVFLKEKLVNLWLELAKRAWPQEWNELIPSLINMCNSVSIF